MKSSPFGLAVFSLMASAASLLTPTAYAASTAADNANNYSSTSTAWTTGSNLGTGFGAWNLFGGSGNGGFSGNYIGGTGLGSNNFGLYAGDTGSGASFDAQRPFTGALNSGQTFSVDLGHTTIATGGSVGINFQTVTSSGTSNVFSVIADGTNISLNDGGSNFGVATDATNKAIHFTLTYNGNNSYSFTFSGGTTGSGNNYFASDDISNINQVQFFTYQEGANQNFGFDNLAIDVPEPSTCLGGIGMVISGLMAFRRSRKDSRV